MRVIATARGFDNIAIREAGDEFEMPDGPAGTWYEPVEAPKAKAKGSKAKPQAEGSGRAETVGALAEEQAAGTPGDGGDAELA